MKNSVKNYIGVDIGGMTIKGIIIKRDGTVLARDSIATGSEDGGNAMCKNIVALINKMIIGTGLDKYDFEGVGIGCPGLIDSKNGVVVFAGNLGLENFPLARGIADRVGLPVKLTNDANAAALGESMFGAGMKYSDSILVTLGTGVGGGIVVDGKLFEGGNSAGTEIGHTVIEMGGYPCTCGRRGCFECYASATALMRKTKDAMEEDTGSEMWKTYTPQTVSGKTAFEYYDTDIAARQVVDWYVKHLACGIVNLANIFRPQVVMLGGGVSEQGDRLTVPVQKLVDKELFAGTDFAPVTVVKASLGGKAGAFGAAALFM
jgi:glucokinase